MRSYLSWQIRKRQFIGLAALGFFLLIFEVLFFYYKRLETQKGEVVHFKEIQKVQTLKYADFNPNDLDLSQWKALGFSEKQAQIILNYKEKFCKGSFKSKEQLSKCFVISEKKFSELSPFILLPETHQENTKSFSHQEKNLVLKKKFNPNDYKAEDWEALGFSARQSEAILRYKKYLGGSFPSKQKLKECFVISEEMYRQLAPYLLLPESTPSGFSRANKEKQETKITQHFNPNDLTKEGWMALGFSERQSEGILKYKNTILRGKIQSLEDLRRCYFISEEKFSQLQPWILLPQKNESIIEANHVKASVSQELELNSIRFQQLVDYGFEERAAASLLGFRKKLGGFMKKEQILDTYTIDKSLAQKLIAEAQLDISKVRRINLLSASEIELKNHPYFRKYSDKILFLRVSYPNVQEVLKQLKAPVKDLEKMQWYLEE